MLCYIEVFYRNVEYVDDVILVIIIGIMWEI